MQIEPEIALNFIQNHTYPCLDVRSESEFAKGALSGFHNLPILNDQERHLVGLCYKEKGQKKAVQLGYELVADHRQKRIASWQKLASNNRLIVTCWRGGLRSQIACEWLEATGITTLRVHGGYKAMRNRLLAKLKKLPAFRIIGGLTGSGKTELLHALTQPKMDLEALAQHRGSAFGAFQTKDQPAQASFENELLLRLPTTGPVYIEDESSFIGSVSLPPEWVVHSRKQPCIWLDSSLEQRVERIWKEYVCQPIQAGMAALDCETYLMSRLTRIEKRLGGVRTQEILKQMKIAFQTPMDWQAHTWIEQLLQEYYDPRYHYAFERSQKSVLIRGDYHACLTWIQQQSN